MEEKPGESLRAYRLTVGLSAVGDGKNQHYDLSILDPADQPIVANAVAP